MRKVLVVVDMQNDFIDGALGTKEACAIVDAVKEKIRSYPPEDVIGFINNNAGNYKYCGTWKVYGDVNRALDTFAKYRKCTELLCRRLRNGEPVEQLTAMSYLKVTNNTKRRKAGN